MRRINENYLERLKTVLDLSGKKVLEIGCGNGLQTVRLAELCSEVIAIDPSPDSIALAKAQNQKQNIHYEEGQAEKLPYDTQTFDVVYFSLSLHHVSTELMSTALDEAIRVVKTEGFVVILEPAFNGTYLDTHVRFASCSGDERRVKAWAFATMLSHAGLQEIAELKGESIFQFDSLDDYKATTAPKNIIDDEIAAFLEKNSFSLNAEWRMNIFKPKQ